jgi:hypothetical protein
MENIKTPDGNFKFRLDHHHISHQNKTEVIEITVVGFDFMLIFKNHGFLYEAFGLEITEPSNLDFKHALKKILKYNYLIYTHIKSSERS